MGSMLVPASLATSESLHAFRCYRACFKDGLEGGKLYPPHNRAASSLYRRGGRTAPQWAPGFVQQQQRQRWHQQRPLACRAEDSEQHCSSNALLPHPLLLRLASAAAAAALVLGVPTALPPPPALARPALTNDESNTIGLFQRSKASVVFITNLVSLGEGGGGICHICRGAAAGWKQQGVPPPPPRTPLTTTTTNNNNSSNNNTAILLRQTSRRDAFTMNTLEIPQGAGSGFVWDKQGHIVTK